MLKSFKMEESNGLSKIHLLYSFLQIKSFREETHEYYRVTSLEQLSVAKFSGG